MKAWVSYLWVTNSSSLETSCTRTLLHDTRKMSTAEPIDHIKLEEYESQLLLPLFDTYAPNRTQADLAQNVRTPFRRNPEAVILEDIREDDGRWGKNTVNLKLQLYLTWECTLNLIDEALLFDGTPEGEQKFLKTTGLTPLRFTQGWIEARGSYWRMYHPVRDGKEVTEALTKIWAVKTQKWLELGKEAARAAVRSRYSNFDWDYWQRFVDYELGQIFVRESEIHRHAERDLFLAFKAGVNFDCTAHPMRALCSCPVALHMPVIEEITTKVQFVKAWKLRLLGEDDAFLYVGGPVSATLFKVRQGGQTVGDFAQAYLEMMEQSMPGAWVPVTTKADFVQAMLDLWADTVKRWRQEHKTRQEVRTFIDERMRVSEPETWVTDLRTGERRRLGPRENVGVGDPLVRVVDFGPRGHQYTAVAYPKLTEDGVLQRHLLRVIPCHQTAACRRDVTEKEIQAALEPFSEEDYRKASAVKAEW